MSNSNIIESFNYSIIPLSPIHINNHEELFPFEFSFEPGKYLRRINIYKYIASMPDDKRHQFLALIEKNEDFHQACLFVQNDPDRKKHTHYSIYNSDAVYKNFIYHIKSKSLPSFTVFPFIRDPINFHIYIPGSTLKGAIRTAILNSIINNTKISNEYWKDDIIEKYLIQRITNPNNTQLLNSINPFRILEVSDALVSCNKVKLCTIKKIYLKGDKILLRNYTGIAELLYDSYNRGDASLSNNSHNFTYSCHKNNKTQIYGEIRLFKALLLAMDNRSSEIDSIKNTFTIENIIRCCNNYYYQIMLNEYDKFYKSTIVREEVSEKAHDLLNKAKEVIEAKNACLMRIGKFCGEGARTFNKKTNEQYLAEGLLPLGWVKMKIEKPSEQMT